MAGKREIVASIVEAMGERVLKKDVEEIVNLTFASIDTMTKKGEQVIVKGFGTFLVQHFKQKKGRNPQTGEDIYMPAHKKLALKVKVRGKK